LHQGLKSVVKREGISINQFITIAVAEKLSALLTEEYLAERAKRGNQAAYLAALAQVPDVEPEEADRLPSSGAEQNLSGQATRNAC
jgi:hypothetical protein